MKFTISRVSLYGNVKPCSEAVHILKETFMDCTEKTVEKAMKHEWVRMGRAVQKNGFVRVFSGKKKDMWIVSLSSLKSLTDFEEKYGQLVIKDGNVEGMKEIEIYDDYRE